MTAPLGLADEYSTAYGIGARTSYDDNINGSEKDPQSGTAQIISPSLKTSWATENATTDIDIDLDFYRYNRPGYDTDNQRVSLTNRWAYIETQEVSLNAEIIRDSTSTSEAQRQDTGVTTLERVSERRTQKSVAPSWSWQFTEQDNFNLGYRYSQVDYGDLVDSGYIGSEEYSVTPAISHALREDWSVFVQADYSVAETDKRNLTAPFSFFQFGGPYAAYSTETTTKGFAIGSNYQFHENWKLKGYIGKNTSDGEYDVQTYSAIEQVCQIQDPFFQSLQECRVLNGFSDYSADGAYSNISLSWARELWDVTLAFNSNVSPSSGGYSQQSDRLSWQSAYKITERQSISLNLAYIENTVVDKKNQAFIGERPDRQITMVGLGWTYRLWEDLSLNASYGYDQSEYSRYASVQAYSVESKSFSLGLVWRPQKMVWAN